MGLNSKVYSGARARFKLAGRQLGYATNVAGNEDILYEPIRVLDIIEVKEWCPVAYGVGLSAGRVRLIDGTDGSLRSTGFFPRVGRTAQDLLQNILNLPNDLTAMLEDNITGIPMMNMTGVKISGHNWAVASQGIVGEDIGFVCIRNLDEVDAA